MLVEAVAAVDRTLILRLEGDLSLLAALRADDLVHLALLAAVTIAATLVAAVAATGRLVLKTLLGVEFLLTGGEDELLATFLAYQRLVFESHKMIPLLNELVYPQAISH